MEDHSMSAGIEGNGSGMCWEGEWGELFSPWRVALIGWYDQARIIGKVARAFRIDPPGMEFRTGHKERGRGRLRKGKFGQVAELYPTGWDAATLGHLLVHVVVAQHMQRVENAHDADFKGVANMVEVELREAVEVGPPVEAHLLLAGWTTHARVSTDRAMDLASELGTWREDWDGFHLSIEGAVRLAAELKGAIRVTGLHRRVNPHKFKKAVRELTKMKKDGEVIQGPERA